MRVTLQVVNGPHAGKRIVLTRGQTATFGRMPAADYQFADDLLMSSRHFAVELDGQECRVRDLDSRNGTYVDDKRVVERAVATGCVIRAGETNFNVTLDESAAKEYRGSVEVSAVAAQPRAITPAMPSLSDLKRATPSLPGGAAEPRGEQPATRPPSAIQEALRAAPVVSPLAGTKIALPTERWRALASREYELALDDPDPVVRRNALVAAAWSGQKWVLEYCRGVAMRPTAEHRESLQLLAILGQPEDLPRVLAIGRLVEMGSERFAILGAFGHPQVMTDVMAGVEGQDEAIARAAAAAFVKITGVEIAPEAPGEQIKLELELALTEWRQLKSRHPAAVRLCRGLDISRGLPPEALACFDLESRWEACLRGRFRNDWNNTPLDDEQLADKLASETS